VFVSDRSRLRLVVLQVLVVSLMLTLGGRLWFLQIYSGAQYRNAASNNTVRSVVTEAVRGEIVDDQGRPLVSNRTSLVVTVDPSRLALMSGSQVVTEMAKLAVALRTSTQALTQKTTLCGTPGAVKYVCWNGSPFQPIPVAEDVTEAVALSILERAEDFPGVSAQLEAVRQYPAPYHANAAHELGYIGPVTDNEVLSSQNDANPLYRSDFIGRTGLEAQYDSYLRGVDGVKQLSVDRASHVTGTIGEQPPVPGDTLVTNLDAHVQAVLEQQLQAAIQRARSQVDPTTHTRYIADSAAGVVMDVHTGAIVAMASLPTYDPSIWVGGISVKDYAALTAPGAGQPLVSRAYQGGYAPGSTFKVVSSTAMLQNGYSTGGPYPCPSFLQVGTAKFKNSESKSYGQISLERAIEVSCDTVFYKVAFDQWIKDGGNKPIASPRDIFIKAALSWGFGSKTGIDLPGEDAGNITTRQDRKATWLANRAQYCYDAKHDTDAYLRAIASDNCSSSGAVYRAGDAVNFIIGQGETLTTPLKMAQVYAAVANGGTLLRPQVAKAVLSPAGAVVKRFTPVAQGRLPVGPATLHFLQGALAQVPVNGTADNQFKDFPLNQIPVAAKTGTAEIRGKQTTSWFATYAPANRPEYAVVMMVTQGGFGSTTSADSVKAVYQALFGIKGTTVDPKTSILPGGPPVVLPVVAADGTILPPGTRLPKAAPTTPATAGALAPLAPGSPATPTALGALAAALPVDVRRPRGGGT
jgi:penicillin-binding protein 2